MSTKKIIFAETLIRQVTLIAQAADMGNQAVDSYFDRGFNSVGADPIIDEDIASLEITADQIAAGITFFQNLSKVLNNEVATQGDYDATLNALRSDI